MGAALRGLSRARPDYKHGIQPDRRHAHDSLGEAVDGPAVSRFSDGRRARHCACGERVLVGVKLTADEKRLKRVQLLSTILLALAAVATAWSSYQAARWTAEYRKASGRTNALRSDAGRAQSLAETETEVDLATFTQWLDAHVLGRTELADFYFRRFRQEFRPAVIAWLETEPLTNRNAPLSPFAMPEYQLAATGEATRLDADTKAYSAIGERASQL